MFDYKKLYVEKKLKIPKVLGFFKKKTHLVLVFYECSDFEEENKFPIKISTKWNMFQ